MKKTVLITGASSGIGQAAAIKFAQKGYSVIGTARNTKKLEELIQFGIDTVAMDVSQEDAICLAFEEIYSRHSRIDILVNNAGYSQNGFVEELTLEDVKYQFNVNVFGLIQVTQRVLPKMRQARSGRIINVGSVGGDFTTPGASAYHASKHAVESFTDGMRQELRSFGIEVSLIKPGGVATNFVGSSLDLYPKPIEGNPYQKQRKNYNQMLESILDPEKSSQPLLTAEQVAEAIIKAAEAEKPKTRYRVGTTAKMLPLMKSFMSDRGFDNMIMKQLKLNQ